MCIWQSVALAGAAVFAGFVPVELGTACWARLTVPKAPAAVAAAAVVRNVRRAMSLVICFLPARLFFDGANPSADFVFAASDESGSWHLSTPVSQTTEARYPRARDH